MCRLLQEPPPSPPPPSSSLYRAVFFCSSRDNEGPGRPFFSEALSCSWTFGVFLSQRNELFPFLYHAIPFAGRPACCAVGIYLLSFVFFFFDFLSSLEVNDSPIFPCFPSADPPAGTGLLVFMLFPHGANHGQALQSLSRPFSGSSPSPTFCPDGTRTLTLRVQYGLL